MRIPIAFLALLALVVLICRFCTLSLQSDIVHADSVSKWTKTEIPLTVYHDKSRAYESALAEGFWQSTSPNKDKQLVFPIVVKLSCYRDEKMCRESDAAVQLGILQSDLLLYDVSAWTDDGIVADDQDEGECGIGHRLAIDFKTNSVTVTDYPKKVSNNSSCKGFQDANSYALHGGQLMLYPPASWDPLEKNEGKH